MNKFIVALFFSLPFMAFFQHAWSDVSITIYNPHSNIIKISGIIADGDEEHFRKLIGQHGLPVAIELNSKGGSVHAAISIGRQIRQLVHQINSPNSLHRVPFVVVNNNETCVSSCVFILAGGHKRIIESGGLVGIHRPFLPEDRNISMEKQKIVYQNIEKEIKDYLEEVNVPITLYDTMFRIPANKIRYLSEQEMQNYNLNEDDPYYHEAELAESADVYGMSKMEYMKFDNERDAECYGKISLNNPDALKMLLDCSDKLKKKYEK